MIVEPSRLLLLHVAALLLLGLSVRRRLLLLITALRLALLADGLSVVRLVPLTEGGGVDLDHGRSGQGVRPDQLVVRRVVDDADDTRFPSDALGPPREVARIETEGTVLAVSTTHSDDMDTLAADPGVG